MCSWKQEHARAQASACQLAAQTIVSNAMNHAVLHEQMVSTDAAEAEACRAAEVHDERWPFWNK